MSGEIKKFAKNIWWLIVIWSIASIMFGLVALFMPGLTMTVLVQMLVALLFVIGVVQIVQGFALVGVDNSGWISILLGFLLSALGAYLLFNPVISVVTFILIVGWMLIFSGTTEIFIGIVKPTHKASWILSGILGIITGIIVLVYPASGTLAFVWVLGIYAIINGIVLLSRAIAARITYKAIASGLNSFSDQRG